MTLNNGTKSQSHNETWSDFVMKSMFKYYLNMTLFFGAQYSAILLHHGVKTTTPFPMRTTRNTLCYVQCENIQFVEPLAQLLNLSISTSIVPTLWKHASICPVPKTACPREHCDFRPISITSVLSRVSERLIIRHFLYPAFLSPPSSLTLTDQYAFRPTGSTAAALIISIFDSVTSLLAYNNYIVVVALDFTKAFDSVRHSTLLMKMAQLDLSDAVFNWLVDYFRDNEHCTQYNGVTSTVHYASHLGKHRARISSRPGVLRCQCG